MPKKEKQPIAKKKNKDKLEKEKKKPLKPRKKKIVSKKNNKIDHENTLKDKMLHEMRYQKQMEKKKIIMWFGVACFMLLIIFAWIFNLKNSLFKKNTSPNQVRWHTISQEFNKKIENIKEGLDVLEDQEIDQAMQENNIQNNQTNLNNDVNILNQKIEELEKIIKEQKTESKIDTKQP